MVEVVAILEAEDLARWREVCALVEVAQAPPADMTTSHAQLAWIDYYELTAELQEKYGVGPEDAADTTISVGRGLILVED